MFSGGGVESTNDDASACKLSAVRLGYWRDDFIKHLVPSGDGFERRAPEIHLGYFTRVTAMFKLMEKACAEVVARGSKMQILSIGAGFDTLYWRLKERGTPFSNLVEVDLPGVTSRKCVFIKRSKALLDTIGVDNIRLSRTELHGVDYHLLAEDFTRTAQLEKKLHECCGWNFNAPTIVLAECVLVYVPTAATTAFLRWCTTTFTSSLVFLNYEQLNMRDRFGQVMLDNLAQRGCVLSGVDACRDKQSQVERFTAASWSEAACWTMNETHALLPRQEVEEAEARERLDERELIQQLFDHYCITVAWRNAPPSYIWDDIEWW